MKNAFCVFAMAAALSPMAKAQPALVNSYLDTPYQIIDTKNLVPLGSGFVLEASNSVYLVTARHVIANADGTNGWRLKTPSITIQGFHTRQTTNVSPVVAELDLELLSKAGDVRLSTNRDIALIRIEELIPEYKPRVEPLTGVVFKSAEKSIRVVNQALLLKVNISHVGEDIFLSGYPASLGIGGRPQLDSELPLLRKGIIAGLNKRQGTVIIDSPVYQGNSGGPVMVRYHPTPGMRHFNIIGIVVEFVPFEEVFRSQRFNYANVSLSNSGYSVVEPVEGILELVWR